MASLIYRSIRVPLRSEGYPLFVSYVYQNPLFLYNNKKTRKNDGIREVSSQVGHSQESWEDGQGWGGGGGGWGGRGCTIIIGIHR